MKILLLTHAFNSLTQRLHIELREKGHEVSVEFDINDATTIEAVGLFQPDLIVAPFLKRAIPEQVWKKQCCLIVHPGIKGDRGPSALDWAILQDQPSWGVTVLQANAEMDAGDIWATSQFPMRNASKASLYRNEITEAAVEAVLLTVERYQRGDYEPEPLDYHDPGTLGRLQPQMTQADRKIDWLKDNTETVMRKIRCADGFPGVLDSWNGREFYLYDARPEYSLSGAPGELIARSGNAVCRATLDGAVWIGHLREKQGKHPFKLPAVQVLGESAEPVPETAGGYQEIEYLEQGDVGYLCFPFYNGAMGTEQCNALRQAYIGARQRETRVIVLMGGADFWSNGLHLNLIEAAESPADESWANINAINDLAREIICTDSHVTVSALQGNAGAGGVFLARCSDYVWARSGVVLNPHYKDMGNLYGSEYWTYLLPKRVGAQQARQIIEARLPMGTREAKSLGLVDDFFATTQETFRTELNQRLKQLASATDFSAQLNRKREQRAADEAEKPLPAYREEELARMNLNFYGFDPSYHVARYNFVYKVPKSRTPITIARHRDKRRRANIQKVL
ncbi:MAG: hydrogenase maturation protein [Sedimenticola sp.]|nr:MAG: hydrogenase maturation protein [Sedimenticola sp.]